MGCFLACFGSSIDAKRRKQRRKVLPRDQRNTSSKPEQPGVSSIEDCSKTVVTSSSASEVQDKPEERFSFSTKKKVAFGSNVRTHNETTEFPAEKSEESGKKEDTSLIKSSQSKSSSEDSSLTSLASYPLNHRYQNCRDSDGEDEDPDYLGCDLSDEDDEDDVSDKGEEHNDEEVESPIRKCDSEVKSNGSNPNARDRSIYVHSVLNPVENLTQWKSVKANTTPTLRPQKGNYTPFSTEPCFKEPSFSLKPESEQSKNLNQEIPVDASLSNWLVSSETTSVNRTTSPSSNSVISHEDRPILGALKVEEIKQFSASCSPKKSPSRSPDEMPIIGTVGTYWNHKGSTEDSGSASSFKGIPNTTSKYREDKRVNWHETPFETRLERALDREVL